jgi:hypothetical protein
MTVMKGQVCGAGFHLSSMAVPWFLPTIHPMRKSFLNGAGTLYIQGANGLTHLQGAPSAIAP